MTQVCDWQSENAHAAASILLWESLVIMMFFPHLCSCDLWSLCDFRYDIDSKSPDLAKHVSEELLFFFVDQEFDFTLSPEIIMKLLLVHVSNI